MRPSETAKRILVKGGEGANSRKTKTQVKPTAVAAAMPKGLPDVLPGAPMTQIRRPKAQPQNVAKTRATKARAVSCERYQVRQPPS
jgi:hypothetical protein